MMRNISFGMLALGLAVLLNACSDRSSSGAVAGKRPSNVSAKQSDASIDAHPDGGVDAPRAGSGATARDGAAAGESARAGNGAAARGGAGESARAGNGAAAQGGGGEPTKPGVIDTPQDAPGPVEIPSNGEVCDGMDNDGNGKIDDADVEGDGVCDCLRIATLGASGVWSGQSVFKDWPNNRGQNRVVALADKPLTDELLKPYQVIVVLDVATMDGVGNGFTLTPHHVFSDQEVAAFERWVRAGGGVMTTIGYRDDKALEVVNVNRLLAPLGMGYSTTKLEVDGMIESWVEHPLTAGVHKIFTAHGVEPDGSAGLTLAKDSENRAALQATQPMAAGDVRVITWGDEWITYDSLWQSSDDQQVEQLWQNMLAWLSPQEMCQKASQ
jgi:hypothetical protein